jgi:hypothetical protein
MKKPSFIVSAGLVSAVRYAQNCAYRYGFAFLFALAVLAGTLFPGIASAQYVATDITPVALFNWTTAVTAVLGIMGAALAAVGGYKISVGIGKKVIAYFGGRG